MSQFLTSPNAIQPHDGKDFRADANGVMTVSDDLALIFRNRYGMASWIPASTDPVAPANDIENDHETDA
jgi:hypothetical protein